MTVWLTGIGIYLFIGLIYGLLDLIGGMTRLPAFAWKRNYLQAWTFMVLILYMIMWLPNAIHRIYYWIRFKITGERHEF